MVSFMAPFKNIVNNTTVADATVVFYSYLTEKLGDLYPPNFKWS